MDEKRDLLLRLAFSMAELEKQMEKRRNKIQTLLAQGSLPDEPEIVQLMKEYRLAQSQFACLESQYQSTKADRFPKE